MQERDARAPCFSRELKGTCKSVVIRVSRCNVVDRLSKCPACSCNDGVVGMYKVDLSWLFREDLSGGICRLSLEGMMKSGRS
jgi:hypothetical protein